jgi:hypothetical protein
MPLNQNQQAGDGSIKVLKKWKLWIKNPKWYKAHFLLLRKKFFWSTGKACICLVYSPVDFASPGEYFAQSYIRIVHPLTFRHRVNIFRKIPTSRMNMISSPIHPVNWKSTGETTGDVIYWFWLPTKLANPDNKDEKLHSNNSPVDFPSPGEYFTGTALQLVMNVISSPIHPVNWKSTGEKTGDVIYWFWLPAKLANPDNKDEKLHSNSSSVDFGSPGEYFAESYIRIVHPLTFRHRVNILPEQPCN